jgi:hypothetical protein
MSCDENSFYPSVYHRGCRYAELAPEAEGVWICSVDNTVNSINQEWTATRLMHFGIRYVCDSVCGGSRYCDTCPSCGVRHPCIHCSCPPRVEEHQWAYYIQRITELNRRLNMGV